jgi:hypothetical protein
MVPWILRELRKWLQWRARRGLTHWWGVAEYTTVGTITARDDVCWKIEDDVGRPVYVRIDQFTVATTLHKLVIAWKSSQLRRVGSYAAVAPEVARRLGLAG